MQVFQAHLVLLARLGNPELQARLEIQGHKVGLVSEEPLEAQAVQGTQVHQAYRALKEVKAGQDLLVRKAAQASLGLLVLRGRQAVLEVLETRALLVVRVLLVHLDLQERLDLLAQQDRQDLLEQRVSPDLRALRVSQVHRDHKGQLGHLEM